MGVAFGGVRGEGQTGVGRKFHHLERQGYVADGGMVESFRTGSVQPNVVCSSPIKSDMSRSNGLRPASVRSMATVVFAASSQLGKNAGAGGSRKVNLAMFTGRAGSASTRE